MRERSCDAVLPLMPRSSRFRRRERPWSATGKVIEQQRRRVAAHVADAVDDERLQFGRRDGPDRALCRPPATDRRAGVVAVGLPSRGAGRRGHRRAARSAAHEPAQEEAVLVTAAGDVLPSLVQQLTDAGERARVHDARVLALVELALEADLADVGRVLEQPAKASLVEPAPAVERVLLRGPALGVPASTTS